MGHPLFCALSSLPTPEKRLHAAEFWSSPVPENQRTIFDASVDLPFSFVRLSVFFPYSPRFVQL